MGKAIASPPAWRYTTVVGTVKGPALGDTRLRAYRNHMKNTLLAVAVLLAVVDSHGAEPRVHSPFDSGSEHTFSNPIDALVLASLRTRGIEPARVCSDATFLRRVYLDVIGTLPDAAEAREFLRDRRPGKRTALIDALLTRDEFAVYWSLKWGDLLRVKAEFPINLWPNAVQAYSRWIHDAIRTNQPYDEFARALLTSKGSNFRVPPVNFYRAMQNRTPPGIAEAVALTFMGTRITKWPEARRAALAAFFSRVVYKGTAEWKEQIVSLDPAPAGPLDAVLPDGTKARVEPGEDPRRVFADWLIAADNPWFARNIVNRVWAWLMGRGIVHEPDDIRPDNPPANPELLALLAKELVKANYDLRHIYRLILTSRTYQQSPVPRSDHPDAQKLFAHYIVRRLDAEVLIDALCQITGTTEKYSSMVPEPFTFVPGERRSIALDDGSITSPFLEMFGRPSRDTGLETERSTKPSARQRLHLLNSSHIQQKIERGPKLRALLAAGPKRPRSTATELYLTILCRYPTAAELAAVEKYAQGKETQGTKAFIDLTWALFNSSEFLYRH